MKKQFDKKVVSHVEIINGADGPTSVFILGKKHGKATLKQIIYKSLYAKREKRAIKSIKANPHSMDEVIEYTKTKWGFSETDRDTAEFQTEYRELRAAFLLQYNPKLLGDLAEFPKLESHGADAVKAFMEQMDKRKKVAEEISKELFDIELCILERRENDVSSKVIIEKKYGYIGGSASGTKNIKMFDKIFRDIYKYYGVSQEDIDKKTKRYEELIKTLAARR
ncbi:MAG: hypothetical protein NC089_10995 [Bacteroides sp.]|nr:hypothetical protein [Bacteroides sp.]MCM1550376.1 hypothetical protein [Clostridium sp.]